MFLFKFYSYIYYSKYYDIEKHVIYFFIIKLKETILKRMFKKKIYQKQVKYSIYILLTTKNNHIFDITINGR